MSTKSIAGSEELGKKIRSRRLELNLTIEEAANRAGVGTKTWCRYEAGESIRHDKCKGICKALNWKVFPNSNNDNGGDEDIFDISNLTSWSSFLEENFGKTAALAFAVGSDILLDYAKQDLDELAVLPIGTHLGQLNLSLMIDLLPRQFLPNYNYDFVYCLLCRIMELRAIAKSGNPLIAHSVLDELIIYMCSTEAHTLIDLSDNCDYIDYDYLDEWAFDLFDDMDIITFLYSNHYIGEENSYHFNHWLDNQFYMS